MAETAQAVYCKHYLKHYIKVTIMIDLMFKHFDYIFLALMLSFPILTGLRIGGLI